MNQCGTIELDRGPIAKRAHVCFGSFAVHGDTIGDARRRISQRRPASERSVENHPHPNHARAADALERDAEHPIERVFCATSAAGPSATTPPASITMTRSNDGGQVEIVHDVDGMSS